MATKKAKVSLEELVLLAGYLSNTAAVITSAMFDSDMGANDCEGAMRYFTENLLDFSNRLKKVYDSTCS